MNKPVIAPIVSEKSFALANAQNIYTFNVSSDLSKTEIGKLIEQQYKVKVEDVNVNIRPGKMKRNFRTNRYFRTANIKKAVVKVKSGDKINEFFE